MDDLERRIGIELARRDIEQCRRERERLVAERNAVQDRLDLARTRSLEAENRLRELLAAQQGVTLSAK